MFYCSASQDTQLTCLYICVFLSFCPSCYWFCTGWSQWTVENGTDNCRRRLKDCVVWAEMSTAISSVIMLWSQLNSNATKRVSTTTAVAFLRYLKQYFLLPAIHILKCIVIHYVVRVITIFQTGGRPSWLCLWGTVIQKLDWCQGKLDYVSQCSLKCFIIPELKA